MSTFLVSLRPLAASPRPLHPAPRSRVLANSGKDKGGFGAATDKPQPPKKDSFRDYYVDQVRKERGLTGEAEPSTSGSQGQAAANEGETAFEAAMRKSREKRKPSTTVRVSSSVVEEVYGKAPKTVESQQEQAYIQALGLVFAVILAEGIFLAASGFLPDAVDQFAQDTVYQLFSPTVVVFLAGSTLYGLWKTGRLGGGAQ